MIALDSDQKYVPTIALMVEQSNLIVSGEITGIQPWAANEIGGWLLRVTVQEVLKGETASLGLEMLSLRPVDKVIPGSRGILFLTGTVRHSQLSALRGVSREDLPQWILPWGNEGILSFADSDFEQRRQYLQKLLDVRKAFINIAIDALRSTNARLRSEAAFDLERYERLEELVPESGIGTMLSALRDATFPDEARATLARAISRLPSAKARVTGILIDLLESGTVGPGFQIEAAQLLTESAMPEALPTFRKLLQSEHHILRAQALTGLGAIGNAEAIEVLASVSRNHPDSGTRDVAHQVLRQREQ